MCVCVCVCIGLTLYIYISLTRNRSGMPKNTLYIAPVHSFLYIAQAPALPSRTGSCTCCSGNRARAPIDINRVHINTL